MDGCFKLHEAPGQRDCLQNVAAGSDFKNLDGKCAVVECNNQMKYNIVSEQYKEPLEAAFEEVIGFHVTVEITTRDNTPKEEVKPKDTHLLPTEQPGIFIL